MHLYVGGGRPKKSSRAAKPPPIDTSNGGIAVYESLDAEYNGVPLDYTYPTPSPTAKYDPENDTMYTYIPTNNKAILVGSNPSLSQGGGGKIEPMVNISNGIPQRNIYHSIGPDTIQHYEFDSNGVGIGALGAFGAGGGGILANGVRGGPPNYHMPGTTGGFDQTEGPAVYEDPTLPKFRVRNLSYTTCI
jgi:hypothetical protein